jgi:hypothetical protein
MMIDLDTPGITIRPIIDMTGTHHFNEIWFEDVLLPHDALVGVEGQGWKQVVAELALERSGPERYLSSHMLLVALIDAMGPEPDAPTAQLIGRLTAEMWTLRQMSMSTIAKLAAGEDPVVEAAIVKDLGNAYEQALPRAVQAAVDAPDPSRRKGGRPAAAAAAAAAAAPSSAPPHASGLGAIAPEDEEEGRQLRALQAAAEEELPEKDLSDYLPKWFGYSAVYLVSAIPVFITLAVLALLFVTSLK